VNEASPNSAWSLAARLMADRHGRDFYHELDPLSCISSSTATRVHFSIH